MVLGGTDQWPVVRRPAERNGKNRFSGPFAADKHGAPGHSGWRVANRDGRVARATLSISESGFMVQVRASIASAIVVRSGMLLMRVT